MWVWWFYCGYGDFLSLIPTFSALVSFSLISNNSGYALWKIKHLPLNTLQPSQANEDGVIKCLQWISCWHVDLFVVITRKFRCPKNYPRPLITHYLPWNNNETVLTKNNDTLLTINNDTWHKEMTKNTEYCSSFQISF